MNIEIEKLLLNSLDMNNHNNLIEIEPLMNKCSDIDSNFHLTDISKFYRKKFSKTHYIRTGYIRGDEEMIYYINILDINHKSSYYDKFIDSPPGAITTNLHLRKVNKEREEIAKQEEERKAKKEPESKKKKNVLTDIELVKIALHMMRNDVKPGKVCDIIVTENNIEHITEIKDLIVNWTAEEMKLSVANNLIHREPPKKVATLTTSEPPNKMTISSQEPPKKKLSLFRRFINFITLKGHRNVV
jgi:hypothetical protein